MKSPLKVIKKKSLSDLIESVEQKDYIGENIFSMTSIQKQIKKIDNAFLPSQGKDIPSMRKLVMTHEYYTTIDSYMGERFKKIKKSRKMIKRQKQFTQQQYNNRLLQSNPYLQNQNGLMQPSFFNQMPATMYMPSLNALQSNNFDQLSMMHQQSITSVNNGPPPLLANIDSFMQNTGQVMMSQQILMSTQSQQMHGNIQTSTPSQSDFKMNVNNYMKLDRVQQSVKKDISRLSNNDDGDDDSLDEDDCDNSESDQRVYEQFSYTYSYIQNDRKKDITIEHHDLKKLVPNQYLNDTIVNFFLKFMEVEVLPEQMKEKVLIFNTYFMSKLAPNDQIENLSSSSFDVMMSTFEKNYQTIHRWIKEDIFEKDFLVFPLNLPEHWSVIIVCNHKNLFSKAEGRDQNDKQGNGQNPAQIDEDDDDDDKMSDEDVDKPRKDYNKPCLLYFDSFGLLDQKYSNMIRLYLNKEFETKKKNKVQKNVIYDEKTLPSHQPLIPRQTNYVDCGLYLLEYVENFLNDPQKILSLFSSSQSEDWMHLKWFPRCTIQRKRKFIKELIIDLSKQSKEDAVKNYINKRKMLIQEKQDNESQYDDIDMEDFDEHIDDMAEYEDDYPDTQAERHRMLLDFYMNPNYNKYEIV